MKRQIVLDTGPLVALLNRRDSLHEWARHLVASLQPPFLTCEAVLSEACFLVGALPDGTAQVMELLERGLLKVSFQLNEELARISQLLARYASVPMSFADACLVRLAEKHHDASVFTADRDFNIYRMHGRQIIPTLMPPYE